MKKRKAEKCVWEWGPDYSGGVFIVECDKEYWWKYHPEEVLSDLKFCPNCGKKVEVKK